MTDVDPEDHPAPQTPIRDARAEPHSRHRRYDVASSRSSPSVSPSLSFLRHPLGMSPFSPLTRQFSSPFASATSPPRSVCSVSDEPAQEDLTQDSKDVLIQRLNDLAARLNHQDLISEGSVLSLHTKVDEMEGLLATHYHPLKSKSPKRRPSSLAIGSSRSEVGSPRGPLTPSHVTSDKSSPMQPSSATKANGRNHDDKQKEPERAPKMSPAEAERVVAEAQLLHKGLEGIIANLRARQEETDHIHDLLITRAERAAQRIIFLERKLKELERERNEGEMEMLNLQIQLKAIEVQCLNYVPKDADHDLRESIAAWKMEWSALKRKRAKNKGSSISDDFGTPTRRMFSSPD